MRPSSTTATVLEPVNVTVTELPAQVMSCSQEEGKWRLERSGHTRVITRMALHERSRTLGRHARLACGRVSPALVRPGWNRPISCSGGGGGGGGGGAISLTRSRAFYKRTCDDCQRQQHSGTRHGRWGEPGPWAAGLWRGDERPVQL